jgi:hypothetical protein
MLHHAALEIELAKLPEETRFFNAIGFQEVPVPDNLGPGFVWLECGGTQIHLTCVSQPTNPSGHIAIITPDLSATVSRLENDGFEVRPGRELWGEKRAKVTSPAGHTVEIMAAPPSDSVP